MLVNVQTADVLTLHIPARDDGSAVVGPAEFAAIKPGAILINCARGSLVDEPALVDALSRGRLHGAGLDTLSVRLDSSCWRVQATVCSHIIGNLEPMHD
eukprot:COSAG05_NODE_2821_length_2603_cov_2.439696_2_plen_99_part_00